MKLTIEIKEPEVIEFESVAQLEQWLERERDRLQREEFHEHLDHASGVVATWPEWERNIFGRSI